MNNLNLLGHAHRETFHRRILAEKIPYFVVRGDLETRVRFVRDVLARHVKFTNLLPL